MYYTLAVVFTKDRLSALDTFLKKIEKESKEKNINEKMLLEYRLAPDMYPLVKQIQIATDNAKGMAGRLAGKEYPSFPDTEASFADLEKRLEKTIAYLDTLKESDFDGAEEREARFPWFPGVHMKGGGYLLSYAIPNFMFHLTTAYAILRHHGFQIGKSDFLGTLPLIPDGK